MFRTLLIFTGVLGYLISLELLHQLGERLVQIEQLQIEAKDTRRVCQIYSNHAIHEFPCTVISNKRMRADI